MSEHHDGGSEFRRSADDLLRDAYEPTMALEEYVDRALAKPAIAADATGYLLAAIESHGTREVCELGETLERYRFFDDPENDGEHAVLGNTATLNAFVDDLRTVAANRGNDESIVWIDGPTATGKSEFKRCLINGLREYSKSESGRRYTLEWNIGRSGADRSLGYGEGELEGDWYRSPVQTHPLSVFPESVREDLLVAINAVQGEEGYPLTVETGLDPFCREAYNHLERQYREEGRRDLFSAITDRSHCRVVNYVVDVGQGIGVLHAEDDGTPKERLVGSWMGGMLRELDSRGRKNPQAFSYDGVLSQGNGLLSVVEDAGQHADLLFRLLNVPDEKRVKLDKGIGMDLDTLLVVISNPDLQKELDKYADRDDTDPLKALKRRLSRHEFRYLTNHRLEAELLYRELTGEPGEYVDGDPEARDSGARDPAARDPEARDTTPAMHTATPGQGQHGGGDLSPRSRQALHVSVRDGRGSVREWELAPLAIGAAALFAVVSRLNAEDLSSRVDLIDKAELFAEGHTWIDNERYAVDEFAFDDDDGRTGIPVTYTRDVIADLIGTEFDRSHPELPVDRVILPGDVIDAMVEELPHAPMFSRAEASEFEGRAPAVRDAIRERQTAQTLDAMLADAGVDEGTVREYVEQVYAWDADGEIETDHGTVEPDPLKMKVFETESLGRFEELEYRGTRPRSAVEEFRRETVIRSLTRYAWEHRDDGYAVGDVDLDTIPEFREILEANDWDDVRRHFPDFDPTQWDDPPQGTETARLKEATIDRLISRGYSRASAELTTRAVVRDARDEWGGK